MLIPLSWLKEYIQINATPSEIAKMLTMAGMEVDNLTTIGGNFEGVVVGKVLSVEKHPNADKLTVAQVTDGQETFQVVCGAPNCRAGIKTAFARIGATLKDEKGLFSIKKSKLRGVDSSGMLCAADELGLNGDSAGIMELPQELKEGTSLKDLYSDSIFEISLTPNLAHCFSVFGIARELSAVAGAPLKQPKFEIKETGNAIEDDIRLTIRDAEACPRYACRMIKDVKVAPSPDWLKTRLEQAGLRSVNNVVDATNYVLLELGHPLHAFDYDQIDGKQVIVRKAEEGEKLTTLDGKERILTKDDLVICDNAKPLALAGVMGGENSEVTEKTQNILLESAYFDPVTIRKTSKRFGIQSDASKRFERGTDPNNIIQALNRAAMLIVQLAGGAISTHFIDATEKEFPEAMISCRLDRVNQLLGLSLSQGELESIFQRLGFQYFWEAQNVLKVCVPTYRVDIKKEIDLIEEVARLYGYDNIPRRNSPYNGSNLAHAPIYLFERKVQDSLIGEGLQEFLTCDLIGPTLINVVQDFSVPSESVVNVLNPTSVEQSVLRTSLLPGLLQVVKYNYDHQNHHIGGFEIGRVHFKEGTQYKEQSVVAIVLSGKAKTEHWDEKNRDYDFFDLKGIVENLLLELNIDKPVFKNLGLTTFHNGRQASVYVNGLEVGSLGEIHPAILRRLDVPQRILFAEFNLHDLIQIAKPKEKMKSLSIYPSSERDWTVTINRKVPFTDILNFINEASSKYLEKVSLLDIYRNEKLGSDFQNMTFRFIYRDSTKTIEQETVEKEHLNLVNYVTNKLSHFIKA